MELSQTWFCQNLTMKRYGNVSEEEERPSLPDDIYCGLIETLSEKCFVTSLLEMWRWLRPCTYHNRLVPWFMITFWSAAATLIQPKIVFKMYFINCDHESGSTRNTLTLICIWISIYLCQHTNTKEKSVRFNEEHIETASQQEILNAINLLSKSPWYLYLFFYSYLYLYL